MLSGRAGASSTPGRAAHKRPHRPSRPAGPHGSEPWRDQAACADEPGAELPFGDASYHENLDSGSFLLPLLISAGQPVSMS